MANSKRGFLHALLALAVSVAACSSCAKGPSLSQHLTVRPSVDQLRNGDFQVVNEGNPGGEINLSRYVQSGKYTVFFFTSPG